MIFAIIIVAISLPTILFQNYIFAQGTEKSMFDISNAITQTITILGGIAVAAVTTFIAWQKERRIPPTAEQERIIQEMIKEWYSNNYLNAYHEIWKQIEESNNDETIIDKYWEKLSLKKFPLEYLPKKSEKELNDQIDYYCKRLHVSKRDSEVIKNKIESIRNMADVEYFSSVRVLLPTIVHIAVMATINSKNKSGRMDPGIKNQDLSFESSFKNLKKLMIFYRIRENKEVCKVLILAKLNEINLRLTPSLNQTESLGEI